MSQQTITDKRAAHELSKRIQDGARVLTWKEWVDSQETLTVSESDGMADYNRRHFNQLGSNREQDLYMARLQAKRYYWVNDTATPKAVFLYAKSKVEGQQ